MVFHSLDGLKFFNWTDGTDSVVVNGNALANNITGSARGDLINGGGGNDTVDGGLGVDTAYYASSLANATITYHADHSVTITTPGEGTDTLLNMEFAHFSDTTISLVPVPQPVNDSYSAVFNTPLIVSGPGVLANDVDPAGLALTAVLDVGPTHGTLALQSNGGFTYTPNANFLGTDTFFYDAFNTASNSAGGAVSIVVGALPPPPPPPPPPPVNHAPVASNDSYTTAQNTALTVAGPGILGNDTDSDGNSILVGKADTASHGTVSVQPGGSFVYTPDAGYIGTDSFDYFITDGSLASNSATVFINVTAAGNHAPVAVDDSFSTASNTVLTIAGPGVLANDSDPDGSSISVAAAGLASHGTVAVQAGGGFVYTPAAGYVGADSFTYAITDGSLNSNSATVAINVTAPPASNFTVTDTTTGVTSNIPGDVYTGPVAGLAFQYIYTGPDNTNVTANIANAFIHTGAGFDAIDVSAAGGTNVLDGGTNSNFLVGGKAGSGSDTFFIDDRSPPGDIWSTVVNFHAGDAATIFGITPNGFATNWVDGEGAAGFTGLTLHVTAPGVPIASITLAGYTTADLGNGRLSQIFGTEGDGTPYLYIHGDS